MIYPVNFKFTVGQLNARQSGSVIKTMNEVKLHQHIIEKDNNFIIGHSYVVYYIKPIKENNIPKIVYTFADLSTRNNFDITFLSSLDADTYIARISGNTQDYNNLRSTLDKPNNNI